ncbi:hypothetical protein VR46_09150 [Streptomyces sp. NRRL S-444]|nr:hypothetical protein VR46_09150 [Streptomyces sp. NRRL S-444]
MGEDPGAQQAKRRLLLPMLRKSRSWFPTASSVTRQTLSADADAQTPEADERHRDRREAHEVLDFRS